MKKQLLAIAIGAATAAPMAAMAEAELYGRFDVTLQSSESINSTGSKTGGSSTIDFLNNEIGTRYNGSAVGDHWELRNNKSRIGVRGSADLDATGNSAIYQLEMQFTPGLDDVANSPGFTLRNTFVGLNSDDYGKLFVGRYDSVIKQAEFSVDQFNNTDADIEQVSALQNRYSDTVNYHSPKFGPSLQVKVQLMPGESEVYVDDNGEADRETSIVDGYGLSLGMEEGNMYGAIAYETAMMQSNTVLTNGVTTEVDSLRVSGGLDGQDFGVGFLWEQVDGDNSADSFGQNSDDSRSGWVISGRFNPTEKVAVKAQYGASDTYIFARQVDGTIAPNSNVNDTDLELVTTTIGADYSLGKQTKVYTFYSMNEADGESSPGVDDDSEFNVLAFGLQHKF